MHFFFISLTIHFQWLMCRPVKRYYVREKECMPCGIIICGTMSIVSKWKLITKLNLPNETGFIPSAHTQTHTHFQQCENSHSRARKKIIIVVARVFIIGIIIHTHTVEKYNHTQTHLQLYWTSADGNARRWTHNIGWATWIGFCLENTRIVLAPTSVAVALFNSTCRVVLYYVIKGTYIEL